MFETSPALVGFHIKCLALTFEVKPQEDPLKPSTGVEPPFACQDHIVSNLHELGIWHKWSAKVGLSSPPLRQPQRVEESRARSRHPKPFQPKAIDPKLSAVKRLSLFKARPRGTQLRPVLVALSWEHGGGQKRISVVPKLDSHPRYEFIT